MYWLSGDFMLDHPFAYAGIWTAILFAAWLLLVLSAVAGLWWLMVILACPASACMPLTFQAWVWTTE